MFYWVSNSNRESKRDKECDGADCTKIQYKGAIYLNIKTPPNWID